MEGIPNLHSHVFLGEGHERNERRTWLVIALCSFMMIAEIAGGVLFGSIALVADGLHMSTHVSALLLAALAYRYARRHVDDERFSFGTGKLGDLAGFASAVVLAMISLLIGYEALTRFIWPVSISFNEAIPIAVLGLIVNVITVLLLSGGDHRHGNEHADHHHEHHHHAHHAAHRDNNLRAAVVHVLADTAVSIVVIGGTGAILLDMNPDRDMAERMRTMIENDGDRLTDLHLWRLGPGHLGAILSVATRQQRGPDYYQSLLRRFRSLSHVTVEVQRQ